MSDIQHIRQAEARSHTEAYQTLVHQKYDIPRDDYVSALETDVVTLVARKYP